MHAAADIEAGMPARMPKAKRLLVLSVSAGAGHVRAADALCAFARDRQEFGEVQHVDVMEYASSAFRRIYTDFYLALVNKHPELWRHLYRSTNELQGDSMRERMRRGLERMNVRALMKAVDAFAPDAIVCTHFLPAEMLAHRIRRRRMECPVWVQVTDFDLHRMWVQQGMAGYFAGSEEVAFRMRAQGIPSHRIHVTGIPVMPSFGEHREREMCAKEFGIDPVRKTVLLMGGGAGLGSLCDVAARLLGIDSDFQLVVLAGRNALALASLEELARQHPGRLYPLGFTDRVDRLMACADIAVTKPGGLTVSECLASGLPMILNSPIPGQEERNADFLLEQGVALKASDPVTLEYRVRYLLDEPELMQAMRARARALGKADAARRALNAILSHQEDQAGCNTTTRSTLD